MNPNNLLADWLLRIRIGQSAHIKAATYFYRLNFWLGIPVVILTVLVGTSVFATLQKEADTRIRVAAGIASVLAAVLAGIQTFLRYSERAEKHRASAVKYGILRREMEQKLAFPPASPDELAAYVDSLRVRWDKLSEECPTAPERLWNAVETKMKSRKSDLPVKVDGARDAA